jgi:hypothetical protein
MTKAKRKQKPTSKQNLRNKTNAEASKQKLIQEIMKAKIDKSVLEIVAGFFREPLPTSRGINFYSKMSNKLLKNLHAIFVKNKSDGKKGQFLEFRTANFIKHHAKLNIERLKNRHTLPQIGEIDVLGFNSKDEPIVMAECKYRKVKKEDIDKWIENVRRIYRISNGMLEKAYFVTSSKLTDGNIERVEKSKDVNAKRGQLKIVSGFLGRIVQNLSDDKGIMESGRVFLSVYEVRQGQFVKIFPRK